MNTFLSKMMQKFVGWLDPKLAPYRSKQPPFTPKDTKQLIDVLRRTPKSVLSARERDIIAAAMSFSNQYVKKIMIPESEIVYVKAREMLGPLTLDKLYKSGFLHFPVVDSKGEVIGVLHTDALNSLKVKETDTAKNLLDPRVYYVRSDYTLEQAVAAFIRTNCYFFLVINDDEKIVGLLTYDALMSYLLGEDPVDDFEHDDDKTLVAKR